MTYPSVAVAAPLLPTEQATLLLSANYYLHETLGTQYQAVQPVKTKTGWQCLIQFCTATQGKTIIAGQLMLDAKSGCAIPLSITALREVQARVAVRLAKDKGALARDEEGFILPYLAKIRVNGYLTDVVSMFAAAEEEPIWLAGNEPCWRVPFALQVRGHGAVAQLGYVDVNAATGVVIPLTAEQILSIQKRADYVAASLPRSAETPS